MIEKLQSLTKVQKWIWFAAGLIGSVICQLLFSPTNNLMMDTGYDILDLEFAWNAETLNPILSAWDPFIDDVITFMIVDMFFPIAYFLVLSGWALLINHQNKCLKVVMTASALASLSDYVENAFTFIVLNNPNYPAIAPFLISLFATIKFLLILFVILRNFGRMIFKK
ncbi:MAG: hypothetical protein INQ03_00040 [Candidatus Heimdallarchaeota archaeon]|nr:hypothetical protein [Candidatus Heimdallarchaeota archaeon]